jgi:hypothetical protein
MFSDYEQRIRRLEGRIRDLAILKVPALRDGIGAYAQQVGLLFGAGVGNNEDAARVVTCCGGALPETLHFDSGLFGEADLVFDPALEYWTGGPLTYDYPGFTDPFGANPCGASPGLEMEVRWSKDCILGLIFPGTEHLGSFGGIPFIYLCPDADGALPNGRSYPGFTISSCSPFLATLDLGPDDGFLGNGVTTTFTLSAPP